MNFNSSELNDYQRSLDLDPAELAKIKNWISVFQETQRVYFSATFKKQNPSNVKHRSMNLLGGTPFTSRSYPWPLTDGDGLPMQPIVQINLKEASEKIGDNLGDGLLQLWGRVDKNRESSTHIPSESLFLLRVIPDLKVDGNLVLDAPEVQPWRTSECNLNDDSVHVVFPDGSKHMKSGSIINWIDQGAMYADASALKVDIGDDFYKLYEKIFDDLIGIVVCPKSAPLIYLGGHGGQAGGYEDPTSHDSLLFRLYDEESFHIGITYRRTKANVLTFDSILRYH